MVDWPDGFSDGAAYFYKTSAEAPPRKDRSVADSPAIPKQELLLKLLKMTTSNNDGEALTALRKANALMTNAGWDWDKLINAKIVVVEDPFKNLGTPTSTREESTYNRAPSSPTQPRPSPPPPSPTRGTPNNPISSAPNRFPGHCWCCGIEAVAGAGFIFKPTRSHSRYEVVCATCNTSATVQPYAAPQVRSKGKKSVSSLA